MAPPPARAQLFGPTPSCPPTRGPCPPANVPPRQRPSLASHVGVLSPPPAEYPDPAPAGCAFPSPRSLPPRGASGPALLGRALGPFPGHLSRRPRGVCDSRSVGLRVRSSRAARVTSRLHHVKRGNKEDHFRYCDPFPGSLKAPRPHGWAREWV